MLIICKWRQVFKSSYHINISIIININLSTRNCDLVILIVVKTSNIFKIVYFLGFGLKQNVNYGV